MIKRIAETAITDRLFKGKAILVFGPRQVGKSTLVERIIREIGIDYQYFNGDESDVRDLLSNTNSARLRSMIGNKKLVFIDEAQRIPDIGLTLKVFTDQLKDVQVMATGSSAFELSGQVNEPLTGRKYEFMLFPLSFQEMVQHNGLLEEKRLIEQRLIYGYYPEVVNHLGEEKEFIKLLAESYLYRDILMQEQIKKPVILEKLLKALAVQVGSEIRYNEIARTIDSDPKTVERYIDLLEKCFVVFRLPGFSRNVRNEIKNGKKIYFYDCGIRNAIINDFRPLSSRTDIGCLWENYIVSERKKFHKYGGEDIAQYFWRTTQQQEIDLIEEKEQQLYAYEIKWNTKKAKRIPLTFTGNYQDAKTATISRENMEEFLIDPKRPLLATGD